MISILTTNEETNPRYFFPMKMKLQRFVKDVLEKNANDSFCLSCKSLYKVIPIKVKDNIDTVEPQIVGFSRDKKARWLVGI